MQGFRAEIEIALPPTAVFDYISDLGRHAEWAQHRLQLEPEAEATGTEGRRFRSVAHQVGFTTRNEVVVVESSRPERFVFEASGKEGRFRHSFELQARDTGTHLWKTMSVLDSRLILKLAAPLFALLGPRNMRKDLERIKARLEYQ